MSCLLHDGQDADDSLLSSFVSALWFGAWVSLTDAGNRTTVSMFKGCCGCSRMPGSVVSLVSLSADTL